MKRECDLVLTVAALPVLLPLLLVLSIIVLVAHGWPVLFSQRRPGLYGKPFTLYKFRTMTDARDAEGRLLPDSARLTRFGKWLRSTSLDELPELLNVLKGDMSLVGPRPLLMEYLAHYSREQHRRHLVPPGLTGWAQVNGRNSADWNQRFLLDLWYVDHHSFWLDCKILLMTPAKVLRRDGIVHPDDPSWEGTFKGAPSDRVSP
ncbi:MAG: sugar transferase [Nitrospiraceae bacterium]